MQLLPAGSIIDLQVSSSSVPRQAQFVLQIAVQKRVRLTNRGLAVRILATAPAKISATLDGVNYRRIQRWSFPAAAGASVHTLRLAHKLQPGTYTLYWLGRTADGGTYRTSQKIRVITAGREGAHGQPGADHPDRQPEHEVGAARGAVGRSDDRGDAGAVVRRRVHA